MATSLGDDNLYGILGLIEGQDPASISEGEIEKAYRKRALECHPDKRPGDKAAGAVLAWLLPAYCLTCCKACQGPCHLRSGGFTRSNVPAKELDGCV